MTTTTITIRDITSGDTHTATSIRAIVMPLGPGEMPEQSVTMAAAAGREYTTAAALRSDIECGHVRKPALYVLDEGSKGWNPDAPDAYVWWLSEVIAD
jgi:hypothetical protein